MDNLGQVMTANGRRYECVAVEDYRRKDGSMTKLDIWSGRCVTCDEPIISKCAIGAGKIFRWRCDRHKRPGFPATPEARQRKDASRGKI